MTFDVHQLDEFVLVGAVVTLAAILAVRVSAGVGLPSLLIYLLIGVVLGEGGPFGIPYIVVSGTQAREGTNGASYSITTRPLPVFTPPMFSCAVPPLKEPPPPPTP